MEQPHMALSRAFFEALSQCKRLERLCLIAKNSVYNSQDVSRMVDQVGAGSGEGNHVYSHWLCIYQDSHRDWKTWKMNTCHGKVMEHEKLAKSLIWSENTDQSWNSTNFASEIYQIYALFADITKFSIGLESWHFLIYTSKCREGRFWAERLSWKIEKQFWISHGIFIGEKIAKYVGTLIYTGWRRGNLS